VIFLACHRVYSCFYRPLPLQWSGYGISSRIEQLSSEKHHSTCRYCCGYSGYPFQLLERPIPTNHCSLPDSGGQGDFLFDIGKLQECRYPQLASPPSFGLVLVWRLLDCASFSWIYNGYLRSECRHLHLDIKMWPCITS